MHIHAFLRKWYDRAYDIFKDFDYKDFLWCEAFVLAVGVLFGVSAKKALKHLTPLIAVFAAFTAFEVFYPRRGKLQKIADGTYEDRFVEFSDTDDVPDFV